MDEDSEESKEEEIPNTRVSNETAPTTLARVSFDDGSTNSMFNGAIYRRWPIMFTSAVPMYLNFLIRNH